MPAIDAWLVTGHALATEVMLDAGAFTVDDPRFSTQQVIGPSMLSLDGSAHRRHRDPFVGSLRMSRVGGLEQFARSRADMLMNRVVAKGSGDLRADVAGPLAVDLMARVLDLQDAEPAQVLSWYRDIVAGVDTVTRGGEVPARARAAFRRLGEAVTRDRATSELFAAVDRGGTLDDGEIVSNVAVLLFGGIVTSESSTAIAYLHLLSEPWLRRRLSDDVSLVADFVDESFLLEPAASVVDRYATGDITLGDAKIAKGDLVRVSLSAANRDPEVFPHPDRFDLTRANLRRSVTFARGPHACLGVHLARLEARLAVEALLTTGRGLVLGHPMPVSGLVFRAPDSVPVHESR
ncbi:MAG: cytochrome P450 [Acidimicrobiia bacterium]